MMITQISLSDTATFGVSPEVLDHLSTFNYIYGANGTGKTTISRVIADESSIPHCSVDWAAGLRLQPMVYNSDYVDRNFNQSDRLKGVFTLGADTVETKNKIAEAKSRLDTLTSDVATLTDTLQGPDGAGGKLAELPRLEAAFADTCWLQKQRHDPRFKVAFEGCRNSKDAFRDRLFAELTSNTAGLVELDELHAKANTVFGSTPGLEASIGVPQADGLVAHEAKSVLKKAVIGRGDADIATMITRLGNSDWVREGIAFYEANDETCPFCQQDAPESFGARLSEYFDEAFAEDNRAIEDLIDRYGVDAGRYERQVAAMIDAPDSGFLDIERLKIEKQLLDLRIADNIQLLQGKRKEPSRAVKLEPIEGITRAIEALVGDASTKITAHNDLVSNLERERGTLSAQVWRYLLDHELSTEIARFETDKRNIDKAVESLRKQITQAQSDAGKVGTEIRELEKRVTSTKPTIDDINGVLSSFGFGGFRLTDADSGRDYRIVRPDGTSAKESLSEGEKNFLTFLYFYHALKGSSEASGQTSDRVVVFDDPVSSLDSEILFIVGSLIKGLLDEVRDGNGRVKQVFVLTHNVYFHKEVTFNPNRSAGAMKEETFWIVRKSGMISTLKRYPENPIKTSYELLWAEVRNNDRSNLSIQNTLRRILENYFRILGNIDKDEICGRFEGRDRLICNSLFSWVNDGSHSAYDDLYVSIDSNMVEEYLDVFRRVFEKMDQAKHYEMMMGSEAALPVGRGDSA